MPYPLIILGAGASYDYIHQNDLEEAKRGYRPPLTKDLFSPRILGISQGFIDEHPIITNLFGELNSALRAGKDFEEYLLEVRDRNPERKKQVITLQYFLDFLFQEISRRYGGQIGNNYQILVGRIKESFPEACFVSFNYDTLLEQSMFPDGPPANIREYVSSPYKLVKVHGSCGWIYSTPINVRENGDSGLYQALLDDPDSAEIISQHKEITVQTRPSGHYPAIAIPIAGKDESEFVCPDDHTEELINALSTTDRILVVGWAARDPALLNLIKEHVKTPVNLYLVCGAGTNIIRAISQKFDDMGLITIKETRDNAFTFSEFLNNNDCDEFMSPS